MSVAPPPPARHESAAGGDARPAWRAACNAPRRSWRRQRRPDANGAAIAAILGRHPDLSQLEALVEAR